MNSKRGSIALPIALSFAFTLLDALIFKVVSDSSISPKMFLISFIELYLISLCTFFFTMKGRRMKKDVLLSSSQDDRAIF